MNDPSPTRSARRRRRAAEFAPAGLVLAAIALDAARATPDAHAAVPTEPPVFTTPLQITNRFFPVVPGAMKVYSGRNEGERTVVVETVPADTRDFTLGAATVRCRTLVETEFEA